MGENPRHCREGENVVDHGRLAEQAFERRNRRLEAHDAALAFDALEHRRLLAADIGAAAFAEVESEGLP